MKKILLTIIFTVLISVFGSAQITSSTKVETKNSNTKKVSISGIVISKNKNELLPNANVSVKKFSTNPLEFKDAPNNIVKTDANGRWELKGIEAGEYRIVISPPGEKSNQINSSTNLASVTKIVDVSNDLENFIVKLPLESLIVGTISIANDQDELGDFYIIATDAEQKTVSGTEIKNKKFKIENLSEGSFKLNIHSDEGYFIQSISLNNKDISNSAIILKDGETVKNVNIVLSKESGYVTGKLKKSNEEKIMVVLLPVKENAEDSLRDSMPAFPDENGVFEFTAPPGEYLISTLKVSDLNKKTDDKKQWFDFLTKNSQKIVVIPAQTTNIDLEPKN